MAFQLLSEALDAYQEGGVPRVVEEAARFVNNVFSLTYNPAVPPVGIEFRTVRIEIGHQGKYLYNDVGRNVVPDPGDTVVEAGVHRGNDTATFAKFANRVVGFEPSPRNHSIAEQNLRKFENVDVVNNGLWFEADELEIMYGGDDYDDGFLQPDDGGQERGEQIPVDTLEAYVEQLDIDHVDFLKVEAEGAEVEILEGMGELRPRHVVVNADEERDGQPIGVEVMELLQPMGYTLVAVKLGHILFFTLEDVDHYAFRNEFE